MDHDSIFHHLSTAHMVEIIQKANGPICYAAPGVQMEPANAMSQAAQRLGPETVTVWVDFDERVMRMGYGSIDAIGVLRAAGITVRHAPALRSALIIADGDGFTFTPTPLYLEAKPGPEVRNALRLSRDQVAEALARLSPPADGISVTASSGHEETTRLPDRQIEQESVPVTDALFSRVDTSLKEAPPVKFDLARQVRVFEPYLQYVELTLSGAAIQRHRLAIPPEIQKLGGSEDMAGRLRTTFDLIEKGGMLSSKTLEAALNEIRKNFTRSLGKDHGRVVLKAAKPHLEARLADFRKELVAHQQKVKSDLQKNLDASRKQVVEYYLPRVVETPPDALLGQISSGKPTEEQARRWLDTKLDRVFPKAELLIQKMTLDERYKDVTFETLNRNDFLDLVKVAFPDVDWEKTYKEFKAAGEGGPEKAAH